MAVCFAYRELHDGPPLLAASVRRVTIDGNAAS
jgi:hypothetical protein